MGSRRAAPLRPGRPGWRRISARRWSGSGGRLSIAATFSLITVVNAVVLGYLLLVAAAVQRRSGLADQGAIVNLGLTLLLVILAVLSYLIIRRRIVSPIRRLVLESRLIDSDAPTGFFTSSGEDEISRLAQGFNRVLRTMRQAVDALDGANRELRDAQTQIDESLRCASLLQSAMLPENQLAATFTAGHAVLWLPRDTVGGDFYLAHREAERVLVGVGDCAGHGVVGAMMAMLARAGVDRAIRDAGLRSPAELLRQTDAALRGLLGEAEAYSGVATTMDLALVLLDPPRRQLRFAGARLDLYCSDGRHVRRVRGTARSLGESRSVDHQEHQIALEAGVTYTLCTDGLLDQSGGEAGFSLGRQRFERWLLELAPLAPSGQVEGLRQRLEAFRAGFGQRDDITLLCFRWADDPEEEEEAMRAR